MLLNTSYYTSAIKIDKVELFWTQHKELEITACKTLTLVLQNIPTADIYKDVGSITKQNLLNLKKFGYIAGLAISLPLTAFRRAMAALIIQNVKQYGKELFEYSSKKKHEDEKI